MPMIVPLKQEKDIVQSFSENKRYRVWYRHPILYGVLDQPLNIGPGVCVVYCVM